MDCPSHTSERIESWLCEPGRNLTSDPGVEGRRLAITEALRQPRQDPLCREIKDWPESIRVAIHLVLGVVVQVARGEILVDPDVPGCRCRLDAKARHQVLAANLSDEAQAQLNECKSVALGLGQVCKLFVGHPGCRLGLMIAS